jgi:hypothetical protein
MNKNKERKEERRKIHRGDAKVTPRTKSAEDKENNE